MSAKDHVFTLGIEEEFQIIDPETRELRSHIQEILEDGKMLLKEHVKSEMHQSVVELGTKICSDTTCAREQVIKLRSELANVAGQSGLKIASAGTHPFSHWMDQLITMDERYATPRPRRGYRHYEPGALFPPAYLRTLGQFAVLVRPKHWSQSIPANDL